ncbi:single-stranded DNA-binding protein [Clostridia bacterium]|nr:single-stranded DNA-binding protein [Clostridia bacterium]
MYSKVIVMGRLTADPELRQTPSGASVTSFRVAVSRPFVSKNGERSTDFFGVTAWRSQAEFVVKFFKKGNMILVDGRLESREYVDKNGANQRVVEIVAENISFTGESKQDSSQTPKSEDFVTSDFKELDDEDLPF